MSTTLRHAAGSLLAVGLGGTELTGLERAWVKLVQPAGVILFRRNIADATQTRALLDEVTAHCATHAFRCVDVEGGSVDRLSDVLAPTPSAQAVAAAMRQTDKTALARKHGELIARGVKAFGFNSTFAPVLDLGLQSSAEVMGTRTSAADAAGVASYAREFLAGLAAQDVAGCGKHFPGLGGGTRDSHLETPTIDRGWSELWNEDLAPYRTLRAALPLVMTSHAAFPGTRGGALPASVSTFWIKTVLRKRIGYNGIVVSDDLEMGGIAKFMPIEEAAVMALRAGTDMFLICHSAEVILRTYEALVAEAERSTTFRTLLLTRAHELARQRARLFARGAARPLTPKQFEALRAQILRFGKEIAKAGSETSVRRKKTLVETA